MSVTRTWKVWGANGQRQMESLYPSYKDDFSNEKVGVRIIEVFNSDKTGSNDFSIVRITRNSSKECLDELYGQISDGIFENFQTGSVEEIFEDAV